MKEQVKGVFKQFGEEVKTKAKHCCQAIPPKYRLVIIAAIIAIKAMIAGHIVYDAIVGSDKETITIEDFNHK